MATAQTASPTANPMTAIVSACAYPGETADAQIAAAIAALPKSGGVVDDRCRSGPQTWKASPFAAIEGKFKPVTLLLGSGTITLDTAGTITICTSCHMQGISRNATLFVAGKDFPANTPVFTMGDYSPSFDVILSQFGVSVNGRPGVTAIYNSKSEEKSIVSDVSIYALNGGVGVDIETAGAQNSGPYENIDINSVPTAPASTTGIRNHGALTRAIRGITVNGGAQMEHGIEIASGARSLVQDYHCENTVDCVYLDRTADAVIVGVYGSDNPNTPVTNAVHISATNQNVTLMDISRGAKGVNNVQDDVNGITETRAEGLGFYATGLSAVKGAPSQSILSSSPDVFNYTKSLKIFPVGATPACSSAADVGKTALLARGGPAAFGYCNSTNGAGFGFVWTQTAGQRDQLSQAGTVALDPSQGSLQYVTLAGNSIGTIGAGMAGQQVTVQICNGAGNYSWAWPPNVRGGGTVNTGPNRCQSQSFFWNGTMRLWIPAAPITEAY